MNNKCLILEDSMLKNLILPNGTPIQSCYLAQLMADSRAAMGRSHAEKHHAIYCQFPQSPKVATWLNSWPTLVLAAGVMESKYIRDCSIFIARKSF